MAGDKRRKCLYSGQVQGVGFRATVQGIARDFEVSGYVRNLPDGRVELVVEGGNAEIDALIDEIAERMVDYIRDVQQSISPATGEFSDFRIRH